MGKAKLKPPPRPYRDLKARIRANVKLVPPPSWSEAKGDCWEWQGAKNGRGYGRIGIRRPVFDRQTGKAQGRRPRNVLVHRLVLWLFRGIPLELVENSCHQCSHKPCCCNPDHLDPGTRADNRDFYLNVERHRPREPGSDDDMNPPS